MFILAYLSYIFYQIFFIFSVNMIELY